MLLIGALVLIAGALVLLTSAPASQETRLGRVAGIAIVVALVMGYAAVRGKL